MKIIKYFCDHKARKILYVKINKIHDHFTGKILKKILKKYLKIFRIKIIQNSKKLF